MAGARYEKARVVQLKAEPAQNAGWSQSIAKPQRWGLVFDDGSMIDEAEDQINWNGIEPKKGLQVWVSVGWTVKVDKVAQ